MTTKNTATTNSAPKAGKSRDSVTTKKTRGTRPKPAPPTAPLPPMRRPGQHPDEEERATAQKIFLDTFAQTANVTKSCEAAGISRETYYRWQEQDETFGMQTRLAGEAANDRLREEIRRRAVDGWDEDVYQLAQYAGTIHKYSDTLLIFHAKARMPEYREKNQVEISGKDGGPIQSSSTQTVKLDVSTLTTKQLAALHAILGESE